MLEYRTEQKKATDKVLAEVKVKADRLGVEAETTRIPDALPVEAIVVAARQPGCNLIVMPSHGRRGIDRLLLGRQTSEVLAHSSIPVHVIR